MAKWFAWLRTLTFVIGVAAFVILGAAAAFLSEMLARNAYKDIALVAEDMALSLNRLFSNTIWPDYADFVASAHQLDTASLPGHPQIARLLVEAEAITADTRILKFKLFDRRGLTVFSSRPDEIGSNRYSSPGLQAALRGQVVSALEYRARFAAARGDLQDLYVVQSYLPIHPTGAPQPVAILEVYTDVTPSHRQVTSNIRNAQAIIFAVFGTAFLLILFVVNYTEREILRRRQENLVLDVARREAEMASRAKSRFLANMSHELRTPLNAIIGFTEMIQQQYLGPIGNPRYLPYAGYVLEAGRHLLKIINDVLDLSKIEAGRMTYEPALIDIAELARSTLRLMQGDAEAVQVTLDSDIAAGLPIVETDPDKLRQVLLNLLGNAVKFTPPGGRITLTIAAEPDHLQIAIADTGIGMRPQDIPEALAPFGQIGSPMSRKAGGTGLGLPLSKQLVELMGGDFQITSTPGLGTTIWLRLPIHRQISDIV
jgi:signal transduction histidine kinase